MLSGGVEVYTTVAVLLVVAFLSLTLGILVFLQSTNSRLNQSFLVMTIAMTLWVMTNAVFMATDDNTQFMSALVSYGAAAWLTISFVRFCNEIVPVKLDKQTMQTIALATILLGFASMMPGFIAVGVESGVIQTQLIPLLIYGSAITTGLLIGNWLLVYAVKNSPKKNQQQYKVLLTGLAIGATIGIVCNLLLPTLGNYNFVAIGPVGLLVFEIMCVYAIAKHGLFDIKQAYVRTVGYGASLISFILIYCVVAYLLSALLLGQKVAWQMFTTPANIVLILLAIVLAVLFQPIKGFFDRATDQVFFRDRYDPTEFISDLGDILTSTTQLRTLLAKTLDHIAVNLKSSYGTFIVLNDDKDPLVVSTSEKGRMEATDVPVIDHLAKTSRSKIIFVHQIIGESKEVQRVFKKYKIAIIVPLSHAKNTIGYLMLGERKAGDYTKRDIGVVTSISNELIIAIQNARSLQALRDFNVHLQQSIETATKELRQSNNKLRKLDESKDEFVSMASHQLRTPLTSIKGYISMVLDGDVGKISPQQRKLLGEAYTSSERMVRLISDFLNVSRIQTGKFMIDARPTDLKTVVAEEVESMQHLATSHGMKLQYIHPDIVPTVYIDEDKTRQVVMNFIDNAIYYSPENTTITVKLKVDSKSVLLEVHDKGIGVPKDKQDKLFTKFFRADNARKQRPDGTGVGLYLAKKVIEEQGGEIVFHSHVGLGSVFGFKLPINTKK